MEPKLANLLKILVTIISSIAAVLVFTQAYAVLSYKVQQVEFKAEIAIRKIEANQELLMQIS